MKKFGLIILIFFACSIISYAQIEDSTYLPLSVTARVLPEGTWRAGLFQPLSYSLTDKWELSVNSVMVFVSPSVDAKYNFYNEDKLQISSTHGLNYPSLLLKMVSASGAGGFISPEFTIPPMLAVRNGLMATKEFGNRNYLTGLLEFEFALGNGTLDERTSIDLPIIAPRSAVFYKTAGFNLGLSFEKELSSAFSASLTSRAYLYPFKNNRELPEDLGNYTPGTIQNFFFELNGLLAWRITKTYQLAPGFRLSYGNYSFGSQWHLLPWLDMYKYF